MSTPWIKLRIFQLLGQCVNQHKHSMTHISGKQTCSFPRPHPERYRDVPSKQRNPLALYIQFDSNMVTAKSPTLRFNCGTSLTSRWCQMLAISVLYTVYGLPQCLLLVGHAWNTSPSKASRRHPGQMPKPPQRAIFSVEEHQLYCESLLNDKGQLISKVASIFFIES